MHIVCPHCTTSYAIDLATLGAAGRTVRCSRCKEVWLARPEDATELTAAVAAMAEADGPAGGDAAAGWDDHARRDDDGDGRRPWSTAPRFRPTGRPARQDSHRRDRLADVARDDAHDIEAGARAAPVAARATC